MTTTKRGPGRPPGKRPVRAECKLSEAEDRLITDAAKALGTTRGRFIREAAIAAARERLGDEGPV